MLSAVVWTGEADHRLVPTLAALVPAAADGVVRQLIVTDHANRNSIATIVDAAGCDLIAAPIEREAAWRSAIRQARGEWLLFLVAGVVLQEGWHREVRAFIENAEMAGAADRRAATFTLGLDGFGLKPRIGEVMANFSAALIGAPRPLQGLLMSKRMLYRLGATEEKTAPRALARSAGRNGMTLLRARAVALD